MGRYSASRLVYRRTEPRLGCRGPRGWVRELGALHRGLEPQVALLSSHPVTQLRVEQLLL